jgi:hypothetical protein
MLLIVQLPRPQVLGLPRNTFTLFKANSLVVVNVELQALQLMSPAQRYLQESKTWSWIQQHKYLSSGVSTTVFGSDIRVDDSNVHI